MEREVQAQFKTALKIYKKREDDVSLRFKDDALKWKGYHPPPKLTNWYHETCMST